MKKILPLIAGFIVASCISCQKYVEKQVEKKVLEAMTTGIWIVVQFLEDTADITTQFLNYDFRFFENGTVTGTIGTNVANGTWVANTSNYSITSEFPSAGNPLEKLNATWLIKDSYWDYVKAETTTPNGKNVLRLRKKP